MGREQWFSTPKDEISLLEIRSKIEHQGVRKKGISLRFLFLFLKHLCLVFSYELSRLKLV